MDLKESGALIARLRKANGLTQKQVADKIGVVPKTVSKWETGGGFPDVSLVSDLAEVLGVSAKTLLAGKLPQSRRDTGNLKKTNVYVCESCGSILQGIGQFDVTCCGKQLLPLTAKKADNAHAMRLIKSEDAFYIRFDHEMTKAHSLGFLLYVGVDRTLFVKLYPEQDAAVRIPQLYGGRFYVYCNKHVLFEV